MKYFKISPEQYTTVASQIDAELGYPMEPDESYFSSLENCVKDDDGYCLVSIHNDNADKFASKGLQEVGANIYLNKIRTPIKYLN